MKNITTTTEYDEAVEVAREAAEAYYAGTGDLLSDADYDALMRAIADWESAHGGSVSTTVAAGAVNAGGVKHSPKMLSLDNVFSADEFDAWTKSLASRVGSDDVVFSVEPKMDGLALAIRYEDGEPVLAATRGDGASGEDITFALPNISNLPKDAHSLYKGLRNGFFGEVRGEAIFTHAQFDAANDARVANGAKEFTSARAGVAGAARGAAGRSYDIEFSFVAYDVADADSLGVDVTRHDEVMDRLEEMGFTTARSVLPADLNATSTKSAAEAAALIEAMESRRFDMDYDTDGIVVKATRFDVRSSAGAGSKFPHWAIAYKYPPVEKTTRLVAWDCAVGRTGVVTPRAIIEPVTMPDGSTTEYVTLHNFDDIKRKDLMVGDVVLFKKAGEVIPRIAGSLVALRDGTQTEIVAPTNCPNCDSVLVKSGAFLKCPLGVECSVENNIVYAASRDALDIDDLGETQVRALVESGLVANLADLFEVTTEQFAALPTSKVYADTPDNRKKGLAGQPVPVGSTTAAKVVKNIADSTSKPLSRLITALGIPGTGRSMSRALAAHYETMSALRSASVDDLALVDKIGEKKAEKIHDFLARNAEVIDRLESAGFSMTEPKAAAGGPLEGMTVVVTGKMEGTILSGSRTEVTERLIALGAKVSSSVNAKTSLLICNDPNGTSSKCVSARKNGVRIVTEDEFEKEFVS